MVRWCVGSATEFYAQPCRCTPKTGGSGPVRRPAAGVATTIIRGRVLADVALFQ